MCLWYCANQSPRLGWVPYLLGSPVCLRALMRGCSEVASVSRSTEALGFCQVAPPLPGALRILTSPREWCCCSANSSRRTWPAGPLLRFCSRGRKSSLAEDTAKEAPTACYEMTASGVFPLTFPFTLFPCSMSTAGRNITRSYPSASQTISVNLLGPWASLLVGGGKCTQV